jgi:predicted O-methyltransferase YrrM
MSSPNHNGLTEYLKEKGYTEFEGNSHEIFGQTHLLHILSLKAKHILEIGFNAGHSSEIFLQANSESKVVSFDIEQHAYVKVGKEYIDKTFPGRHELVLGDSLKTIPSYTSDVKFDLIFIDGCHELEFAKGDLDNCQRFAHKDTIVIMDDTMFTAGWDQFWNEGPSTAWVNAIKNKQIKLLAHADFTIGRGMAWGKYIF